MQYTDEQYYQYFNEDPNWTKEETDLLFKVIYNMMFNYSVFDHFFYPHICSFVRILIVVDRVESHVLKA